MDAGMGSGECAGWVIREGVNKVVDTCSLPCK